MIAPKAPAVSAMSAGSKASPSSRPACSARKACGVLLAGLVGEPVLVAGHGAGADRRDEPLQRHLVRIAEGEVGDAGREPPLGIARVEVEVLDRREGRGRGPDPGGNRHG